MERVPLLGQIQSFIKAGPSCPLLGQIQSPTGLLIMAGLLGKIRSWLGKVILDHPELQHPFSTMASMLSEFVKKHWLIFDEAEAKYSLRL